jgi:serine/threonine protein kinase
MISQTPHSRYQPASSLGQGAMGVGYRALDRQTQQEGALKVIAADLAPDGERLERFRREGEALRTLRHRNSMGFVDMFVYQGHQVIVIP